MALLLPPLQISTRFGVLPACYLPVEGLLIPGPETRPATRQHLA